MMFGTGLKYPGGGGGGGVNLKFEEQNWQRNV
jgi:hypothetical protein